MTIGTKQLTLVILAGILSLVSCAKKEISSRDGIAAPREIRTEAGMAGASRPLEDDGSGTEVSEIRERLAREKQVQKKEEEETQAFTGRHILFAFDSARLDEAAKALVREKAAWWQGIRPSLS